jgi:CheY-like chemotaxis protein/anti-sigma regulatory factor (Ser/Thr protein kinase)
MSHELRTPLSTISGFAQLLHSNLPPGDERDMADSIVAASNHVNGLVRDLLDYSRADADALGPTLSPVSLRAAIDEALELVSGTARDLDVRVDVQVGDEHVLAVHRHLVQVVLNLLSNAVKFGGRGGTVRARSVVVDGCVTCSVTDEGPGIPVDLQLRAFQPFERLDNAKGIAGVGLGLAISEALMRAMKGTLTLSSPPGQGATFTIQLPLALSAEGGQESSPDNDLIGTEKARLVLYVEDEPLNASLMESIVSLLPGRRLLVEPTVAGGISAAAALRPALILLDIHLPDGSGFDVLQAVRADPATAAIPVFVLSADATEQAERHALELGVDRFITKPFNINDFVGLVDEVT